MPTKWIFLRGYKSGASLALNVTSYDGTTAIQSNIPGVESGTGTTIYGFALTADVTTQTYGAQLLTTSPVTKPLGNYVVDLQNIAGNYPLQDEPSAAQSAAAFVAAIANGVTLSAAQVTALTNALVAGVDSGSTQLSAILAGISNLDSEVDAANAAITTNSGKLDTISTGVTRLLALEDPPPGSNLTAVDENYGGANELQYVDPTGQGIIGATVLVFTQAVYQQSTDPTPPAHWAIGRTTTTTNGKWASKIWLTPGRYVVQMELANVYAPSVSQIVVGHPPTVQPPEITPGNDWLV